MNKRIFTVFMAVVLMLLLSACGGSETMRRIFVMDSTAEIRIMPKNEAVADEVCNALFEMDNELSAYDGELAEINKNGGGDMGKHILPIVKKSQMLCDKTGGLFSPVLGVVTELWGIGSRNYLPTEYEVEKALKTADMENIKTSGNEIRLTNGARLNFGGITKGYAADTLKEILIKNGVDSAVVSLGGNIYVHGKKQGGDLWNVAIRDPSGSENDWLGMVALSDKFVITSGDYERYFERDGKRYHHIFDPRTGKPCVTDLAAAAVICENGAMGDAYSTALYIMGRDAALSFWRAERDFELILVGRDGVVTVTEGLSDVFTSNEEKGYVYETESR